MTRKKNKHSTNKRGSSAPVTSKAGPARSAERSAKYRQNNIQDSLRTHAASPTAQPLVLSSKNSFFLFGRNSVEAALKNPKRECLHLYGTEKSLAELSPDTAPHLRHKRVTVETHDSTQKIASSVPEGSPHQGILLEVRPLPGLDIQDLVPAAKDKNIILMLDQVTDPHNVGACLRSAAAFGAKALITQDKNSPSENGVIARAAAGALELMPWIKVANLSQTLDTLKDFGYWHIGLDGNTNQSISGLTLGNNIVIVMGSEGKGLRPLVRKNCDIIAKIPMSGSVESLNVSNAAAIALYELTK